MNTTEKCTLILDHPSLVPLHSRLGWGCVTVLFWGVWIYLWIPLATLAAWSFGFYQAHHYFQWEREVIELKRLLGLYSIVVTAFGGALLLWALSEYVRFRNKHRRFASLPAQPQELARHADVPAEDIAVWQRLRCVLAFHDDHGGLTGADGVGQPSSTAPLPSVH